ncbi:hypothetical protein CJ030_MR0G004589 [Morella rubra]|uniref:PGG domain-containing protein n=1 Tax=Morella rubra TaxID=262757 RepID=A0A6A1ULU1_9ROSI|nr:hypothetical protein CJ030_MR0G004589 [Morella rubra]
MDERHGNFVYGGWALIVTIMFAVAFAVPGGNNQETGLPMFSKDKLFALFIIFDALSLFSSTISVLMFLGILTSHYAEEDFLKSLPQKMIIGLSTLFFSIATMMMAFCVALFIMLPGKLWMILCNNYKDSMVTLVSFGEGITPKEFEASKGVLELRVRAIPLARKEFASVQIHSWFYHYSKLRQKNLKGGHRLGKIAEPPKNPI